MVNTYGNNTKDRTARNKNLITEPFAKNTSTYIDTIYGLLYCMKCGKERKGRNMSTKSYTFRDVGYLFGEAPPRCCAYSEKLVLREAFMLREPSL